MDINYVFPDTLFNLVKDTIFASENESDSERRKQTLNKVAITVSGRRIADILYVRMGESHYSKYRTLSILGI